MGIMSSKPSFSLSDVSERRRTFLREWRRERAIDLKLRGAEAPSDTGIGPISTDFQPSDEMPKPRPYDVQVSPGEIRLLGPGSVSDPFRFAYVAVLEIYPEQGIALAASFSPYATPATKDEWLTGLESTPLRVLQLWNAQPLPIFALKKSWRCCSLTEDELKSALELYRHTMAGTWPSAALREQIGLAVHDPEDARLFYQNEEMALYSPLREALFNLQAVVANAPIGVVKPGPVPIDIIGIASRVGNIISEFFRFELPQTGQVFCPLRMDTGSDGKTFVQTTLLRHDGSSIPLLARRISHDCSNDGEWESRWSVDKWEYPISGLPAFVYSGKSGESSAPFVTTFTGGESGKLLIFTGNDPDVFEQLEREDLWFLIREI
jgi:hypothetical protein